MGITRKKLLQFLRPDPPPSSSSDSDSDDAYSPPPSTSTSAVTSPSSPSTPYAMSPWTQLPGLVGSPPQQQLGTRKIATTTGLLGSLVKDDGGHVYSLAAAGDLLYTGTDSRTVRVWRDRRDLGGFRSGSGLVKAVVVDAADGRIYTGHQDGKVRVWRRRRDNGGGEEVVRHRRVGSLPRVRDAVASALLRLPYTRRRHSDAVSCLSLDAAAGLLYSGSWDRTVKVWRVSDSRCLESVPAHDDAVNAVAAAGFDALLFTGSADGTVKVWRRREELDDGHRTTNKGRTRHDMERVLRRQGDGGAVTAIAVAAEARVVYVGSSDGAVTHWQFPRVGGGGPGSSAPRNGGALRGHRMAVLCVAVARGGRVVVSGSADRTVAVWRRQEGAEHARLAVLRGHTGPVKCVAMDAEEEEHGRWVVYSGSLDGSVKVWRVSDDSISPTHLTWKGASPPPLARSWTGTPLAAAAAGPTAWHRR